MSDALETPALQPSPPLLLKHPQRIRWGLASDVGGSVLCRGSRTVRITYRPRLQVGPVTDDGHHSSPIDQRPRIKPTRRLRSSHVDAWPASGAVGTARAVHPARAGLAAAVTTADISVTVRVRLPVTFKSQPRSHCLIA